MGRKVVGIVVTGGTTPADVDPVVKAWWRQGAQVFLIGPDLETLESCCLAGGLPVAGGVTYGAVHPSSFDVVIGA
jgi:hypothetical protein